MTVSVAQVEGGGGGVKSVNRGDCDFCPKNSTSGEIIMSWFGTRFAILNQHFTSSVTTLEKNFQHHSAWLNKN